MDAYPTSDSKSAKYQDKQERKTSVHCPDSELNRNEVEVDFQNQKRCSCIVSGFEMTTIT